MHLFSLIIIFRPLYGELGLVKKVFPPVLVMTLTGTGSARVKEELLVLLRLKDPLM